MIPIMCIKIMDVHEKHSFVVSVHTSARWVKPILLAEPIFCNPDVTDGKEAVQASFKIQSVSKNLTSFLQSNNFGSSCLNDFKFTQHV